ncbi:SGNH/GDSL hydrolase family protein [Streptomyces sp. NPDC006739]|uniref:SGNH/GDSL hydrolase family protein n=1 Tax=Streptomyces sp. NPDC006739 TaxID=3364763 RepID=UPI0036B7F3D0
MIAGIDHVAALGSSFAAGPGIEPLADRAAGRSARNYPHLLAERLGARLTDLTVSGATTATLLDTPQRRSRRRFPPQLDGLPSDVDLVTVTAGGNDLGYIGGMVRLGLAGRLSARPWSRPLGAVLARQGVADPGPEAVGRAAAGLVRVVEAVRLRAPGALVVLVDYPVLIGPDTHHCPQTPFDPATLEGLRRVGERVAQVFATAAERSGATLVPMAERSRPHALGSADPWVTGLPDRLRDLQGAAPFHPNAAGMRAIADAVHERLSATLSSP